jgi:hypothetical protein
MSPRPTASVRRWGVGGRRAGPNGGPLGRAEVNRRALCDPKAPYESAAIATGHTNTSPDRSRGADTRDTAVATVYRGLAVVLFLVSFYFVGDVVGYFLHRS